MQHLYRNGASYIDEFAAFARQQDPKHRPRQIARLFKEHMRQKFM